MNLYEFINKNDGSIKMNSDEASLSSISRAVAFLEAMNDTAEKIIISKKIFYKFKENIKKSPFGENSSYFKTVNKMKFLGADIIIDESCDERIISVIGKSNKIINKIEIFIN